MEMKNFFSRLILLFATITTSCIGTDIIDDFVEARVVLTQPLEVMIAGDNYQFKAEYFDNTGVKQSVNFRWDSSDPGIIEINDQGLASAISSGKSLISSTANNVTATVEVTVLDPAKVNEDSIRMIQKQVGERTAVLQTVSSYKLEGMATLTDDNGLKLVLSEDFETSSSLPGLYLYLTNNVNTINNALEIGEVRQFSGGHVYDVPGETQLQDYSHVLFYCKPFVVPVGNGKLEP